MDTRYLDVAKGLTQSILYGRLSKKSIVTGLWLRPFEGTALFNACFLHVLQPKQYPYFRFYYRNIVLVSPVERKLWIEGSEEARISYALDMEEKTGGKVVADWGVLKALEASLKEEYRRLFPHTKGMLIAYHYSVEEEEMIIGPLNKKFLEELKKGSF